MINNTKTEEDLMNLKGFSSRPKVHGSICNLWFHSLRNRYPWEYLLFSQDNNNQDYYRNQIKAKIERSINKKIELIVSGTLTQETVDELNSMLIKLQVLSKLNLPNESKIRYARNN
jgi:hypothetical protein